MTARDFPWPLLPNASRPTWTDRGFRVGDADVAVLEYSGGESGWSDGLTLMHEAAAGDDHPINQMSRRWAIDALRRHLPAPAPVVLEVGCSSGFLLRDLQAAWPQALLIGSDFLAAPLERLADRTAGLPLLQFDLVQCPLPDQCVDVVILLNVFEHIADDRAAAQQVARILRPGGIAIVELPAGPHLYDAYDAYLQHHRRYSAKSIASLLTVAGLDIREQSHLGCAVYPAFAYAKRRRHALDTGAPDANQRRVEAQVTQTRNSRLLRRVLQCEAWLGRYLSFPFGIRCVTVARKPAGAVA
jgi:SAM-dependent methyltransferase